MELKSTADRVRRHDRMPKSVLKLISCFSFLQTSTPISLDAVGDGICDVLFSNDAHDLIGARHAARPAKDDRHDGFAPPHPIDDVEENVVLPRYREVFAGHLSKCRAGLFAFEAMPQTGIDPLHAHYAGSFDNDDMLHVSGQLRVLQKLVEAQARGKYERAAVHDVAGVTHQNIFA